MCKTRKSSLFGKITVLVVICFFCLSAHAKYGGGNGTAEEPYLIYDANQMNAIGADSNDWDKHFLLCTDIDLSGYTGTSFNIIGYWLDLNSPDNKPFTGVFDGNGHTISNFTYTSTGTNYIGLFGYVSGENAEVKDLGLIDPNVDAGSGDYVGALVSQLSSGTISGCYAEGGSVSGDDRVGGLVGSNFATITNCYAKHGSISGDFHVGGLVGTNEGTITNCYSQGDVSGWATLGGLVGDNFGTITNSYATGIASGVWFIGGLVGAHYERTITNSYATGSVSGKNYVGGLVGCNFRGTISDCYATGSVTASADCVGGLVGDNGGGFMGVSIITNCYSTGSVSGDDNVGGLVGINYSTINNCYSTGSIWGDSYVGGLVGDVNSGATVTNSFWDIETSGQTSSAGGTGLSTAQMQMMNTFTDAGWDFENIWWIFEGAGYPRLCWENKYGGGSGRHNNPYLIYTAEQMNTIGACQCDWDKCFKLMADIDLSGYAGTSFNIIGELYYDSGWIVNPFTGVFDGNGHILSNFTYTSTDTNRVGLFGYVDDPNAEIKDLGLINPDVNAGTGLDVGSLVGLLSSGKINNCYVVGGSVSGDWRPGGLVGENEFGTITSCYSTTSVSGDWYVGGLAGDNKGTITNCYSTGSVSGDWLVGGLLGRNYGTVINCYATASVSGTDLGIGGLVGENNDTITNCYSAGSVTGTTSVGGLAGENGGTITKCYSTGSVSGTHGVGGLVGSGAEWRIADSFWDIETSGQATSSGGTGKTTAEMQMMSTFTDAGWDFVGETVNGIEDIWFIPQQDYPHLWWEGMQVPMKLTPGTLNCRSKGGWVKAHLVMPAYLTVEDVDSNILGRIDSLGIEADFMDVFVDEDGLVRVEMAFDRAALCEKLTGDGFVEITVRGFLTNGHYFYGTETIKVK
jgi:hypothetical protein